MNARARATVYLDRVLFRAVKVKAAASERTISDLVGDALRRSLREDADDLAAFEDRAGQPRKPFEEAVKALRRAGRV